MATKQKVRLSRDGERLTAFIPPGLNERVRVEAVVRRESISDVVTRRLRESYERDPAPHRAMGD